MDGINFSAIDSVVSVGHTNLASSYQYTHKIAGAGKSIYRIRVMNRDGSFELSKLLHFEISATQITSISAYPNPASAAVIIKHAPSSGNDKIEIRSVNGKLLYSKLINRGSKETPVSLSGFKAGIYTVVCNNQAKMLVVN